MAAEYTVYVNIEAYDPDKRFTNEDDCWHPSEEVDLAKFDNLGDAERFVQALSGDGMKDNDNRSE